MDALNKLIQDAIESVHRKDRVLAEKLLRQLVERLDDNANPLHENSQTWAVTKLAILLRYKKDFVSEAELLERYITNRRSPLSRRDEFALLDRLEDAREYQRRFVAERGKCDMCDAKNRMLTRIESGHVVCTTCMRSFGGPKKEDRVSSYDRNFIQQAGLDAPLTISKAEATRLKEIIYRRELGLRDDATDEEYIAASRRKQFHAKVRGITFDNVDGTSRQSIISRCAVGERLVLVREPTNSHNGYAVKVCRETGEQIGYLGDNVVGDDQRPGWGLAEELDEGRIATVVIALIYPVQQSESHIIGVVVEIVVTDREVPHTADITIPCGVISNG